MLHRAVFRGRLSLAALAVIAMSAGADCPPVEPGEPSEIGAWELLPYQPPVFIVHLINLPNGKVLMFAGDVEQGLPLKTAVWDPKTDEFTMQNMIENSFCGGHALMADGRVLVAGGASSPGVGTKWTDIFDPETETWTKMADMNHARWYPTVMAMPDGRVMAFSGTRENFTIVNEPEVYDPATDTWTELPPSAHKKLEIYPGLHLLSDGRIFYSGTRWNCCGDWFGVPPSAVLDLTTNTWADVGNHIWPNRSEAFALLVPPLAPGEPLTKVMVFGGYGDNQKRAEIIDLSDPQPAWKALPDTTYERNNVNGLILADGTVAAVGGLKGFKWDFSRVDSKHVELFDPATETWTVGAAMQHPHQYHSAALLLPDGRVLKAGGHDGGGINIMKMEIYSPPYLFRGERPAILGAPAAIAWGKAFTVQVDETQTITRLALVRAATMTHHTAPDLRYIPLAFEGANKGHITAQAPPDANWAPPGYYTLFVLNECGVPSEGVIVRLGEGEACYPDLDGSGDLTLFDFLAFVNLFNAADPAADCDGAGGLSLFDFLCFVNAFNEGC